MLTRKQHKKPQVCKDNDKKMALKDVWRMHNIDKFDYTWAKNQKKNHTLAHLGFLLTFPNMIPKIKDI